MDFDGARPPEPLDLGFDLDGFEEEDGGSRADDEAEE